jgi:Uma2 family endonuclease
MAHALRRLTNIDEFLAWEERQPERWEFVEGRVYLMSGGTRRHDRLTRQLANALESALGDGPCAVHGPNVKVRTPSGASTYPDALIRCGPEDEHATSADDPIAIFEVLSPGTMYHDLKRKRRAYESISTLRFIGFVWPDTVAVSFVVRDDEAGAWREDEAEGLEALLTIAPLDVAIALKDVYARTGLALEGA